LANLIIDAVVDSEQTGKVRIVDLSFLFCLLRFRRGLLLRGRGVATTNDLSARWPLRRDRLAERLGGFRRAKHVRAERLTGPVNIVGGWAILVPDVAGPKQFVTAA
jgi:hypothetical protein